MGVLADFGGVPGMESGGPLLEAEKTLGLTSPDILLRLSFLTERSCSSFVFSWFLKWSSLSFVSGEDKLEKSDSFKVISPFPYSQCSHQV